MWYYLTRLPWRDKDALPPVELKAAKLHANAVPEQRSGAPVYGWVETYEPLESAEIERYGLIEGDGDGKET